MLLRLDLSRKLQLMQVLSSTISDQCTTLMPIDTNVIIKFDIVVLHFLHVFKSQMEKKCCSPILASFFLLLFVLNITIYQQRIGHNIYSTRNFLRMLEISLILFLFFIYRFQIFNSVPFHMIQFCSFIILKIKIAQLVYLFRVFYIKKIKFEIIK